MSPTWVNLAVVILSAGIFVANVWGFGLFPGLIWGLAPWMFIALLAPGERRWRGRHPGVQPEATPVHIAFVVLYALNLALVAFLAARGASKPSGTSLGQILPQVAYLGCVLWLLTRNLRRQRRIWEHTQAGHPPNGAQ